MASAKASVKAREERHAQSGDQIVLGMLDVVDRNPDVTQRSVASELGIALGLANSYLKRCVRKGLIKVSEAPTRRYAYYLTPQGFAEKSRLTAAYLRHSFSLFHQARVQFGELFAAAAARGQRRVVLLGAGDLADIASLVAAEHPVEIAGTLPRRCRFRGASPRGRCPRADRRRPGNRDDRCARDFRGRRRSLRTRAGARTRAPAPARPPAPG